MTKIVAHRGASYLAGRDNTLESFRLAIELGADMVEFDFCNRGVIDGKRL